MRSRLLIACATVLALAACDKADKAAPAKDAAPSAAADPSSMAVPKGFTHEAKVDHGGYYLPKTPVQVGVFKLTHIFAGGPSEFQSWEGGQRQPNFGPLMLEFDDVTSPVQTNELGQPYHTVTIRVLPTAYHMTKAAMAFHGQDATLGAVIFAGAFNQKALGQAKGPGSSGEASVLKGDLQVGKTRFGDIAFTYFAGD